MRLDSGHRLKADVRELREPPALGGEVILHFARARARAHARVTDARREFHHRLSTKLIRENQAVTSDDWRFQSVERR